MPPKRRFERSATAGSETLSRPSPFLNDAKIEDKGDDSSNVGNGSGKGPVDWGKYDEEDENDDEGAAGNEGASDRRV